MVRIQGLLSPDQVRQCRDGLKAAGWVDGRVTAGAQSALNKHNLQLPETAPEAKALSDFVLGQLMSNPTFLSAALPARVFPPLFNRYDEGMGFGAHIDNAVRFSEATGARYRTDLSCTLFLSDPDDYDGGELVITDAADDRPIKLPAGDMIVYPATSVHRVEPVRRGSRWASFFWVQSLIKDAGQRALLYDMDQAVARVRADLSDAHPAAIALTGGYHNLIRMWSEL